LSELLSEKWFALLDYCSFLGSWAKTSNPWVLNSKSWTTIIHCMPSTRIWYHTWC